VKKSAITGPTSVNNPNNELQKGPPFNHTIIGSFSGVSD